MKQQRLIWIYGLSLGWLLGQVPVWADITPDRTLSNPSQVRRQRNATVITGGTQTGRNLFHSFREFSLPSGTASFQDISPDVTNIFSRVTGRSVSRINGVLEALQRDGSLSRAHFWLINPNGIQFGRNASLNLGGAFVAATADTIRFADGVEFSAVDPQPSPVLSVNVPVGLQFGPSAGLLRNQSRSNLVLDEGIPIAGGLQVSSGQMIGLMGSPLEIAGGYVNAPGGQIELGSVRDGLVRLNATAPTWQFDYRAALPDRLDLSQTANVDATDYAGERPGGSIQLWGGQIQFAAESAVLSSTLAGSQPGRAIAIQASALALNDFSLISTDTTAAADSGEIRIQADQIAMESGAAISTRTAGAGSAGDLRIRAQTVTLSGEGSLAPFVTGLFAQTAAGSTGEGGNIQITANQLVLTDGAQIGSDTSGRGRAGAIQIQAATVELSGVLQRNGRPVLQQQLPFPSGIFADSNAEATAPGGDIRIQTRQLQLRDGAVVQTNAEGSGNAGNVTLRASGAIDLSGTAGPGLTPTTVFAASGGLPGSGGVSTATGRGGTLRLVTPELRVGEGAVVAVSSLNPNQQAQGAGNLEVQADQILLTNRGRLVAETASGDGGNIDLRVQDTIQLRNQSQISTSAGVENRGGNGGNLTIESRYIFAAPLEDSDIRANAFTGSGGTVQITSEGIVGTEPRSVPTALSDITASSQLGAAGQIIIRSPEVNPTARASELPTTPLGERPAQGCEIGRQATAEFFNTGRGGLPITPTQPLSDSEVLADLRLPEQSQTAATTPAAVVEAAGWFTDAEGKTSLVTPVALQTIRCALR